MIKEFTCTVCPKGCSLTVDTEKLTVTGNGCKRGEKYGIAEATHPERTLTSTVKITGGEICRAPVKTSSPIPKEKIFDIMRALENISISAPVSVGDIALKNVCDTGSDIIITKNIKTTNRE